jgi:hypothetical protein
MPLPHAWSAMRRPALSASSDDGMPLEATSRWRRKATTREREQRTGWGPGCGCARRARPAAAPARTWPSPTAPAGSRAAPARPPQLRARPSVGAQVQPSGVRALALPCTPPLVEPGTRAGCASTMASSRPAAQSGAQGGARAHRPARAAPRRPRRRAPAAARAHRARTGTTPRACSGPWSARARSFTAFAVGAMRSMRGRAGKEPDAEQMRQLESCADSTRLQRSDSPSQRRAAQLGSVRRYRRFMCESLHSVPAVRHLHTLTRTHFNPVTRGRLRRPQLSQEAPRSAPGEHAHERRTARPDTHSEQPTAAGRLPCRVLWQTPSARLMPVLDWHAVKSRKKILPPSILKITAIKHVLKILTPPARAAARAAAPHRRKS